MDGKWFLRVIAVVVVLVIIAGVGYATFNAGVAQGLASKALTAPGQAGTTPMPYYGWPFWFAGSPFWGFHLFGLLFGIFVFIMVLRLISFAIWGPRWGHMRHAHFGWDEEAGVPMRFKEWHDRAHGAGQNDKGS